MSWTRRRSTFALLALGGAAFPLLSHAASRDSQSEGDDAGDGSIPNLFISPCGEPFRAPPGAPYPVVDWFRQVDKNHDGKIDRDEFVGNAKAFFKRLDINGEGALSRYEVRIYEQTMVPEILGGPVTVIGENGGARLWLAQFGGSPAGGPGGINMSIDPGGDHQDEDLPPHPKPLDVSGQGAAPYSFFQEPEPILTADFNVDGVILLDNYLKVADMHFTALDENQRGYLTLNSLPKTAVEKLLEKGRHHGP